MREEDILRKTNHNIRGWDVESSETHVLTSYAGQFPSHGNDSFNHTHIIKVPINMRTSKAQKNCLGGERH